MSAGWSSQQFRHFAYAVIKWGASMRNEVFSRGYGMVSRLLIAVMMVMLLGVASGARSAEWVKAGPIWNDMDAQRKCPQACGGAKWDGNWKTTEMGEMSVCACGGKSSSRVRSVDAGPIWGDFDAPKKCKAACGSSRWDGNWRTVGAGRSTCDCEQ